MGIDLRICPRTYGNQEPALLSCALELAIRDYDLFDKIKKLAVPLSFTVMEYGDEGLYETSTDPYGDRLTGISADPLRKLLIDWRLNNNPKMWFDAALAYILELESDHLIILWWH